MMIALGVVFFVVFLILQVHRVGLLGRRVDVCVERLDILAKNIAILAKRIEEL